MSATVDNRVVEMRFENKQFEANAANTMSTLDKLKKSLKLEGAAKGFEEIDAASKKVDMGHLGNAVEAVRTRFSALEVMGVTALANITNQAVNAGKKLAAAFTIEPIKTGFQEYETQIGAIQTILANTESKGTTLGDVNNALDTLNTYADKTIYNFTEMTRNIGTFTAAGVDLEKSVSSIQGIANLAAVSGSTSQQASTAMYQLSQALAAGRVSLMDWNSVVNAGMGGQVFQDALKRTSEAMGTGAEKAIKKYGSFRESLTKGEWLTTDVLTKTLEQFTMAAKEGSTEWEKYKKSLMDDGYTEDQALDILKMANTATDAATKVKTVTQLFDTLKEATQSGWTQTWELLVGDFGEAKDLLTEVSDTIGEIIGKSAESRNKILSGGLQSNWSKLTSKITESGIELDTFETKVKDVAKEHNLDIDKIIQEHGSLQKAFKEGAISSDILKEAVSKLGGSMADLSKIERTLKKGSSGDDVKAAQQALKDLGHDIGEFGVDGILGKDTESAIKAFQELKGLEVTGIVDNKTLKALKEAASDTKDLSKECDNLIDNITKNGGRENLIDALRNSFKGIMSVIKPIKEAFTEIFPPATAKTIYTLTENIKKFSEGLILSGEKAEKVKRIFKGIFSIFDIARKVVSSVIGSLFGLAKSDGIGSFADMLLNTAAAIGDFFTSINEGFDTKGLTGVLDGISNSLSGLFKGVSSGLNGFGKMFISACAWIRDAASDIWGVIKDVFGWISENISSKDIFAGLAGGGIFVAAKKIAGMCTTIKEAIDKLLGKGDGEGGINGLKETFVDVLDTVKGSLQTFTSGIKIASLVSIALSMILLSSALRKISELKAVEIGKSLLAMALMFTMLTKAFDSITKSLNKFPSKGLINAGVGMVLVSAALVVLADAMEKIGKLSLKEIGKGLLGVGAGLTGLTVAASFLDKVKIPISTALSILALANACDILGDALGKFGALNWDELKRGLAGMGIALAEFVLAIAILGKVGGFSGLLGSVAILIAVQSLDELSENLEKFGNMSWDVIGRGLVAMGGALTELGVIFGLLGYLAGPGAILGAASIWVGVQGLGELADALQKFGAMSWEDVKTGLAAMGAALGELAVGGLLNTLSIIGAFSITEMSSSLGVLADSVNKWNDVKVPENLSDQLATLGKALSHFLFDGSSASALSTAAPAVGVLADSFKKWDGVTFPEDLGSKLQSLGTSLKYFLFGGIGATALATAAPALGTMADSVKKWTGVTIPEGLNIKLLALAAGIQSFMFGETGASVIATAAPALGTMADSVKKWAGVTVPETLKTQLTSLSDGVKSFTWAFMGGWSLSAVAGPLGDLASDIKKWNKVSIPSNLSSQLTSLSDAIKSFSWAFLGGWSLSAITGPLGKLAGDIKKWNGVAIPKGLGDQLSGLSSGIKSFAGIGDISSATKSLSSIASSASKLSKINFEYIASGSKLMNSLISGMIKTGPKVKTTLSSVLKTGLNGVKEYYDNFESAGKSIAEGLAKGITANTYMPVARAKAMAKQAYTAAKEALQVNSPSKIFRSLGYSIPEGLAMGIDKLSKLATRSAVDMTDSTISTVSSSLSRIADYINSDIDSQPTISPVLDLSNVKAGASTISGMLSGRATLSVGTQMASAVATSMSSRQNGNTDVVTAINKLRKDLANFSGTTYQINGITYSEGTEVSDAVSTLVRAARIERRV